MTPAVSHIADALREKLKAIPAGLLDERTERRKALDEERQLKERFQQWDALVKEIGVRYADCHLEDFELYDDKQTDVLARVKDYQAKLAARVKSGDSIVFYGPSGTGKDHMLSALMRVAIIEHGFRVEWRNGMDLYGDFRDSMDSKETRESQLVKHLVTPQILAISDPLPPIGNLTDFQKSTLFRIVDGRYRQKRPTWITVNVSKGSEAADRMGVSVLDRLTQNTLALHCSWPSYRKRDNT